MKELGAMYEENNKEVHIVYNFGSSGALQQAIENGGAADVFVSAAQKQMNALDEKKLLADGTRVDLLVNDIVLITAKDSKLNLPDFKAVLDPQVTHIALGEPKGVPVGQYSEEVFTKLGILDQVKARAVYRRTSGARMGRDGRCGLRRGLCDGCRHLGQGEGRRRCPCRHA